MTFVVALSLHTAERPKITGEFCVSFVLVNRGSTVSAVLSML